MSSSSFDFLGVCLTLVELHFLFVDCFHGAPGDIVTVEDAREYWNIRRRWQTDVHDQDEIEFVAQGLPRVEICLRHGTSRAFPNEIVNFRHWSTDDVIVTQTFVERGNSLSVSLQCRYHGCRFMLIASKCPDRMALR